MLTGNNFSRKNLKLFCIKKLAQFLRKKIKIKNYEKKLTKEDVKIDLKHDSIEFAASTDGDDTPDTNDAA